MHYFSDTRLRDDDILPTRNVQTDLVVAILLGVAGLVVALVAVSWPLAYPNASLTVHRWVFWSGLTAAVGLVGVATLLTVAPPKQALKANSSFAEQQQPIRLPASYSLTVEQQQALLTRILPLKNLLPKIVISRSSVPGGDVIMMQMAQVFARAGIAVVTGFQQPTGPSQVGLFVCVPEIKHTPKVALELQKALAEVGLSAPLAELPPDATQNEVVIFAGPEPL